MGYRNYFYIADKSTIEELSTKKTVKELQEWVEQNHPEQLRKESYPETGGLSYSFRDLSPDIIQGFELGKLYWDSDNIDGTINKKAQKLWTKEEAPELENMFEDEDVKICQPDVLVDVINIYKQKILRNLEEDKKLLEDENETDAKKTTLMYSQVVRKIDEWNLLDIPDNQEFETYLVTRSWLYEYEIFNLISLYKFVDWDNKVLVYLGY